MSGVANVLATLDGTIAGTEAAMGGLRGRTREECADALSDLRQSRAALSNLFDRAREAVASGCPCSTCDGLRAALLDCGCAP